jgi:hypothetical protein
MNANNLKRILEDKDFAGLVADIEGQLTAKVMSPQTTPEDRASALHQFHGLQRVMKSLIAASNRPEGE